VKDEHEDFDRPRRHTRPRTKDRPNYDNLPLGRVIAVDRGRYAVQIIGSADGERVTTMKARSLGRQGVVVGDEVRVDGDVSGDEGSLGRIAMVMERRTVLRRTADDDDPIERIVVANADQLVIVTALADPPPRPALIDRCLVAAYDAGMEPVVVLTKSDLAAPDEMIGLLEPLDVRVVVTQRDQGGDRWVEDVRAVLTDRTSVLIGHSGVGKSTLVNALVPDADRATSTVNEVTGRGRHTSTSAVALPLPGGGWIIDTPGFRSFGLAHVDVDHVLAAFPDMAGICTDCPRGCTHLATEPECALDAAVSEGTLTTERVESLRRILTARLG
jgi:ribosome biogenesis GTPase